MSEVVNQVAIIGCEHITAANIYSLLMNDAVTELILIDNDCGKLFADVNDLLNTIPLAHSVKIKQGGFIDAAKARIAVIAAGIEPLPGETPLELLGRNAPVIREIAGQLKRAGFNGIILMTTNPVDMLAQIALEESGLPPNKVIGSGAVFQRMNLRAAPETATWCAAQIGDAPLVDFCQPNCPDFGGMLDALKHSTPNKNPVYHTPGTCVNRICRTILRDEQTVLPVAVLTTGQYGISGVYLNLPCVIGKNGIGRIVEFPLSDDEKKNLLASAAVLKETCKNLKINEKSSTAKSF